MIGIFFEHFPAGIAELSLDHAKVIRFTGFDVSFPVDEFDIDKSQISCKLEMLVGIFDIFLVVLALDDVSDDPGKISVFHLLPVFLQGKGFSVEVCYFSKDGNKFLFDNRLQDVIKTAVSDGSLCVSKIIVTCEKDKLGIGDLLPLYGLKEL